MGGPRLSVAGLMILVGVIALDCAILAQIINLWDRSAALAICLLINVMPPIIGAEIAILFAFRPPASRSRQTRHLGDRVATGQKTDIAEAGRRRVAEVSSSASPASA